MTSQVLQFPAKPQYWFLNGFARRVEGDRVLEAAMKEAKQ